MKYLGNAYHDHQKQVGNEMVKKGMIKTPEHVEDAWLTFGCWAGVVLIVAILLAKAIFG